VTHTERRRAESFGEDAALYDRARPGYPASLVADLTDGRTLDVLDVGCGTGKAARAFAAAGCRVLGVEVDERMAAVARASGVQVEAGRFEEWDPAGRRFDLVVAGQAWHWVDPDVAPARAAGCLREGGALAPFWNYRNPPLDPDDPFRRAETDLYRRIAPGLVPESGVVGLFDYAGDLDRRVASVEASGRFEPVRLRTYPWSETLSNDAWLDRVGTQSEHRLLDPAVRAELFEALRKLYAAHGDSVQIAYTTYCIVARRR
jgi:SAM-dependent methyltransferase